MSLINSLKTSAYYDDTRFNHLKVAVVKYLVNNGTTSGATLIKNIGTLKDLDLDIMVKYKIIHKKIMAIDDSYSISDWAKKLIVPNIDLPILTVVNTDLDNINIETELEPKLDQD